MKTSFPWHNESNASKSHLNSSPPLERVVAQRIMETIRSTPMLCSILMAYFVIACLLSTGEIPYGDLALINVRMAQCWASALLVGSLLYWLIRLPDSQRETPIPTLTREEVEYLKGGIKEVFKERLSEISVYIDQMGISYRIEGGDLTGSAEKALGPHRMLIAKRIKDSLQEKRLVLGQPGKVLRTCTVILLVFCFLNVILMMIIALLLGMAAKLGLPPVTYKQVQMSLSAYTSSSAFLLI
jgi:hypothetical protein